MMNNDFPWIEEINILFISKFQQALDKSNFNKSRKIIQYLSPFYRQWYYSALIDSTILSPANLVETLTDKQTHLLAPSIQIRRKPDLSTTRFTLLAYTLENHPITDDLKMIVQKCDPAIEMTENNMFKNQDALTLLHRLSMSDPFYLEYLVLLGLELGLISKMPSLYANRIYTTSYAEEFFQLSKQEQFHCIIHKSLNITCNAMNKTLILPFNTFRKDYILSLLQQPHLTDDIFKKFFATMGINIENIWRSQSEGDILPSEFEDALITSSFILGIMIDKYFYSIYGYFLKLIQPLYTLPMDFDKTLHYVRNLSHDNLTTALHAPCSTYSITSLGMEYFDIQLQKSENNMIASNIPAGLLAQTVIDQYQNQKPNIQNIKAISQYYNHSSNIYEVKIKLHETPKYWKTIEIPSSFTLHHLHELISSEFEMEDSEEYDFYMDSVENPFVKYSRPMSTRKHKNPVKTAIRDLNWEKGDSYIYIQHNTLNPFNLEYTDYTYASFRFTLEILNKKEPHQFEIYPKISRISKAFKEVYADDDTLI